MKLGTNTGHDPLSFTKAFGALKLWAIVVFAIIWNSGFLVGYYVIDLYPDNRDLAIVSRGLGLGLSALMLGFIAGSKTVQRHLIAPKRAHNFKAWVFGFLCAIAVFFTALHVVILVAN